MRILILANNDIGLYKFRKELVNKLIDEGNEVYLSLPYGGYIDYFLSIGCKFIDTPVDRRGTNVFTDLALMIKYYRIISSISPDCILSYTIKPNLYGGLAAMLHKKKVIWNITGLGSLFLKKGIVQNIVVKLYKVVAPRTSCIFFQNKSDFECFEKLRIKAKKQILIPGSGVNLRDNLFEEYPSNSDGIVRLLFVARLMRDKGIDDLIEAMYAIKSKYPNAVLDVVGPCESGYDAKAQKWNEEGIINYYGPQKDVHQFMTRCHALIHPSYVEGMSNVCLEAAACGRPILASKIPGCIETFDEGISGYGFNAGDINNIVLISEKFLNLTQKQREKMGLASRKKAENKFDREIVIGTYISELKRIEML